MDSYTGRPKLMKRMYFIVIALLLSSCTPHAETIEIWHQAGDEPHEITLTAVSKKLVHVNFELKVLPGPIEYEGDVLDAAYKHAGKYRGDADIFILWDTISENDIDENGDAVVGMTKRCRDIISIKYKDASIEDEYQVLLHEIGHGLCLPHNENPESIMFEYLEDGMNFLPKEKGRIRNEKWQWAMRIINRDSDEELACIVLGGH